MVVPWSGPGLEAVTSPPCWRTMLRTRKRPRPVPLILTGVAAGNAVEAVEDALVLVGWEAEAGVGDTESDLGVVGDGEGAADVDSAGGVLDGVVEEVEDRGAEVFGDAEDVETNGSGDGFEHDGFGGEVVALEGDGDAVVDESGEVDEDAVLLAVALAELAGLEDLLDGGEKTVGVGEHDLRRTAGAALRRRVFAAGFRGRGGCSRWGS